MVVSDPRFIAIASALISLWLIAIDPVINRDAIVYLRTADAFLVDGLSGSFATFDRPVLPIAFATIHQLTGLSLLHAGQLFTTLLYIGLSLSLVRAVAVAGGNRQVQAIAALIVLTHPILNDYRSSIMRDPGFWAFALLGMTELIRYSRQPGFLTQLRWLAYWGIASLFRFEATLLALLSPLALILTMPAPRIQRLSHVLRLQAPVALVFIIGFTAVMSPSLQGLEEDGLLPHIDNYAYNLLYFNEVIDEISVRVGPELLQLSAVEHARSAVFGGLIAVFLLNLWLALMWPYAVVLVVGWWRGWLNRINRDATIIINVHLAACAMYLLVFTFANQFIIERYCSQIVMFLLIYVSFAAQGLWNEARFRKPVRALLVVSLILLAGDILHNSDYRKAYLDDATVWLRDNLPASAALLASDKHIAYFSGHKINWNIPQNQTIPEITEQKLWQQHQYFALSVDRRRLEDLRLLYDLPELRLLKSFTNDRMDSVLILENTNWSADQR